MESTKTEGNAGEIRKIPSEKLKDVDFMRKLVKRVMLDSGGYTKLEACTFVAGMFEGTVGWDIYRIIEGIADDPKVGR